MSTGVSKQVQLMEDIAGFVVFLMSQAQAIKVQNKLSETLAKICKERTEKRND